MANDLDGSPDRALQVLLNSARDRLHGRGRPWCAQACALVAAVLDRDQKMLDAYRYAVSALEDSTSQLHEAIRQPRLTRVQTKRGEVEVAVEFWKRLLMKAGIDARS